MNGKILFCLGTRPEWLKIKPILNLLSRDQYKILFTGQHEDLLKDIEFDYQIVIYPTKKVIKRREQNGVLEPGSRPRRRRALALHADAHLELGPQSPGPGSADT